VLAYWHDEPEFVTAAGRPRPLKMNAAGICMTQLVQRALPGEKDARAVVKFLLKTRCIRKRGDNYVPTSRQCIYLDRNARLHALDSLLEFLRTVDYNVSHTRAKKLFERIAINTSVPVRFLPEFYAHANAKADDLMRDLDSRLQHYARSSVQGPRTRMGLGIYVLLPELLGLAERMGGRLASRSSSGRSSRRSHP
jgi:hypothetical protein